MMSRFGQLFEPGPQLIKKKWFNHLQDIGFSSVMRTLPAPFFRMHDGLEERSEYRG